MNQTLETLKAKAVENKELLIRIGLTVAGALVGAAITTVIANVQEDALIEEIIMEQQVPTEA